MPKKILDAADRERARVYGRFWYKQNAAQVKARITQNKRKLRQWFREYKSTLVCQRCGENDPATLDFHHRDPAEKDISIAHAIHNGWSIERILEEIEKCDVLCANCHKRLHRVLSE